MQGNTFTFTGNLVRDPQLRYTRKGTAVANFSLAVENFKGYDDKGEARTQTLYVNDITCWRELAGNVAEDFRQGMRVTVTGHFEPNSWEGDDGSKNYRMQPIADDVALSMRWGTIAEIQEHAAGKAKARAAVNLGDLSEEQLREALAKLQGKSDSGVTDAGTEPLADVNPISGPAQLAAVPNADEEPF